MAARNAAIVVDESAIRSLLIILDVGKFNFVVDPIPGAVGAKFSHILRSTGRHMVLCKYMLPLSVLIWVRSMSLVPLTYLR